MPVPAYAGANVSVGNGVTAIFPYNFEILDQAHVEVRVDGVLKVIGADYTVSGVGLSTGGNITFGVAPANGSAVQRARKVPYLRLVDYQANGDLKENTLDADLDISEMQIQQLAADIIRAFKAPLSVTGDLTLSDANWAGRASGVLGFDAAGNFGVFSAAQAGVLAVSAYIATLLDDVDAPTARATLGALSSAANAVLTANIADGNVTTVKIAANAIIASKLAGSALSLVGMVNGTIVQTRAGNAETWAIKTLAGTDPSAADPTYFIFRDQASTTGGYVVRTVTAALSHTLSSGSTSGCVNNEAFRLWLVAFDDAGVVRLSTVKATTGSDTAGWRTMQIGAWGVASSTAEGGAGAADSAQVFYTTGATVSAKPYIVIGYSTWEAGLAAAGTWGTAPSRIQLYAPGVPLPGQPVMFNEDVTTAVATTATAMPDDDTIPQSGEGGQFLSGTAFTPSSAADLLRVSLTLNWSHSALNQCSMAIFRDAVANALFGSQMFMSNGGSQQQNTMDVTTLAGSTASTQFKGRAGGNTGATLTFNGAAGARKLGGVDHTSLKTVEIMA